MPATRSRDYLVPPPPDTHRSLEVIDGLEHFLSKVQRQLRIVGEILLHHRQRLLGMLAADERAEPTSEEEDSAIRLDVGERIQGRAQIRERQRSMFVGV